MNGSNGRRRGCGRQTRLRGRPRPGDTVWVSVLVASTEIKRVVEGLVCLFVSSLTYAFADRFAMHASLLIPDRRDYQKSTDALFRAYCSRGQYHALGGPRNETARGRAERGIHSCTHACKLARFLSFSTRQQVHTYMVNRIHVFTKSSIRSL